MDEKNYRQLAVRIAEQATPAQNDALKAWALKLLDIRNSDLPARQKAKKAIAVTVSSKVVWPMVKIVASQTKSVGWDNRTVAQRLGLGAAAVGVALFGGQSAGIAALGGAIGVPLWIVLGAGSMFARYLYEELALRSKDKSGASYSVIDAEKVDGRKP
ncbi:hypothetical protein EOD29_00330 [Mesorhizobium sp. M1A.T.Ca.IN.004.03.1.1]|uniref:hypothetical protein n=1 Tax=Mesorhizobium sp. M1A.T.Ca.IN.004.03.1.1 TaxID=2496795 RepID=UPI000FCC2EE2|nr:hypothetical protein [Mesorhizobium sp. M1A.T.Ca.IN.004.03.1.1]RUV45344.1 hypothetical protein EOD29_00330 [Mesorhizobium sp. M1A.T.Ca.IN.004.03.1.1]